MQQYKVRCLDPKDGKIRVATVTAWSVEHAKEITRAKGFVADGVEGTADAVPSQEPHGQTIDELMRAIRPKDEESAIDYNEIERAIGRSLVSQKVQKKLKRAVFAQVLLAILVASIMIQIIIEIRVRYAMGKIERDLQRMSSPRGW